MVRIFVKIASNLNSQQFFATVKKNQTMQDFNNENFSFKNRDKYFHYLLEYVLQFWSLSFKGNC